MTNKELKRLGRKELLEILIDQTKEINMLRDTVQNLNSELNERKIIIAKSGSLAEASLKLNGLFIDADNAARQYIENAKHNAEESRIVLEEARKKSEEMIAEAEEIRSAKIREANLYINRARETVRDEYLMYPEIGSAFDEEKKEQ